MRETIKTIFVIVGVAFFLIVSTASSPGEGEGLSLVNEEESSILLPTDTCACPPLKEAKDSIRKIILNTIPTDWWHRPRNPYFPGKWSKLKKSRIFKEDWMDLRFNECNPPKKDDEEETKEEICEKKGCYYSYRVQLELIFDVRINRDSLISDTIYSYMTSTDPVGLPCQKSMVTP